jgi:hypothetical protein
MHISRLALPVAVSFVVASVACSSAPSVDVGGAREAPGANPASARAPHLTTRATRSLALQFDAPPAGVYAISDVHGGYARVAALLANNGIVRAVPPSPAEVEWTAGSAILVVCGDLVDKGPQPVEVIDFFRALEPSAESAGGRVVVLLGNHEVEFFSDPNNAKASGSDGFDTELAAERIAPASVASGADPRGAWLRGKAIAAKVGGWFFAHAGNTKGRTLAALDGALVAALAAHPDYDDPEFTGPDSILESRDWFNDPAAAATNATALGVGHVVFGHTPSALGPKGAIATARNGALFRIDCGMSPDVDDSQGCILHVRSLDPATEVARALDAGGRAVELWRGAPAP